jgi:hypothetical protein
LWKPPTHRSSPPDRVRVAILNGFGRSLGDSIIGLQALAAALALGALSARPVLFRLPGLRPMVQAIYAAATDLADVRELPWADETPTQPFPAAAGFAAVIDMRDFAFDPAFRGVPMIDYFLGHLGLAPATVPPALRRNAWLAPRVQPTPPAIAPPGYTLVCPLSAMALRDMPHAVHDFLLARLLESTEAAIVTQGEPSFTHERVLLSPPAATLADLCGLVAGAERIVSTDTAIVHLADAFSVPCLAFFTTHRPEWRVRDYPFCAAVHLPAAGLPSALEFARTPADLKAAHAAWFPAGPDLGWLAATLQCWLGQARALPSTRQRP